MLSLHAKDINPNDLRSVSESLQALFLELYPFFSGGKYFSGLSDSLESDLQRRLDSVYPKQVYHRNGIGLHQPAETYTRDVMACYLDSMEQVECIGSFSSQKHLAYLTSERKKSIETLGLPNDSPWEAIEKFIFENEATTTDSIQNMRVYPEKTWDIVNDNYAPNTFRGAITSYKDIHTILLEAFPKEDYKNRSEFLKKLGKLEISRKMPEKIYALKYRLSQILQLPNTSTWEQLIIGFENRYPEHDWIQKKEA